MCDFDHYVTRLQKASYEPEPFLNKYFENYKVVIVTVKAQHAQLSTLPVDSTKFLLLNLAIFL